MIEIRNHYKREHRNKYRLLLLEKSGLHQPIFLECQLNTNRMPKGAVKVNDNTKVSMDLIIQFETLKKFAKKNEMEIYHSPLSLRKFFLKKNKNKTLYGGYITELKSRVKFYYDPLVRLRNVICKSKVQTSVIKTSNVPDPIFYIDSDEVFTVDKLEHFTLMKYILNSVDKPSVFLRKFTNGQTLMSIDVCNLRYTLLIG